jgi:hypothetical protein
MSSTAHDLYVEFHEARTTGWNYYAEFIITEFEKAVSITEPATDSRLNSQQSEAT